jgi:hypothetical protein
MLREETMVPLPRMHAPKPKARPILPVRRVTLPVTAAAVVVAISFALQITRSAEASGAALVANQRVHAVALASHQPLPSAPPISPLPDPPEEDPNPPLEAAQEEVPAPAEPIPRAATAAPEEEPVDLSTLPLLRAVKFTLAGAESIGAECLGARAVGTTSVLVREPRAGPCTVRARMGGSEYETEIQVEEAAGLTCTVEGEALTCR